MFTFEHQRSGENRVPRNFWSKIGLLQRRPDLAAKGRYTIASDVGREVVDLFFRRVMGDETAVATAENAEQLRALCDELGFAGFDDELRALLGGDWKMRRDVVGLQGRVDRHDVVIEELQRRVLELERQLRDQRGVPERVEAVERRVEANLSDARREAGALRSEVGEQVNKIASRLDVIPSIEARLNEVVRAAREDVARLRSEVGAKAGAGDVVSLSQEVARLKEAEARRARSESAPAKVPATPRRQAQAAGKVTAPVGTEFVYNQARPRDGIIAHLTRECGGNVHKKGVVNVTASSCFGDWCKPENAVDLESDLCFGSNDSPNSWICYDFGGQRVTPTSYSIRSRDGGPGYFHPKSWVLEVSNDGSEGSWEAVDSRKDNNELNDENVTRNFSLGTPQSGAFRFVRLRLTGENHYGCDNLDICALELFGTLSE